MRSSKLILGTANVAQPYGLFPVQQNEIQKNMERILELAYESGVSSIDTAESYGNAVSFLKKIERSRNFRIINKSKAAEEELANLDFDFTDVFLLHVNPLQPASDSLYRRLLELAKKRKPNLRVGVSVYNVDDVGKEVYLDSDLVQVPFSLLDQRFLSSGLLSDLRARGVEVHARSIFLQGLLVNEARNLKGNMTVFAEPLQRFHDYCAAQGLSPLDACLHFVSDNKDIDGIVCGFNSVHELKQLIDAESKNYRVLTDLPDFRSVPEEMLKPYNWKVR
jgi:aryl-alcohol dehydrogenase-like predicted oxidoreductase